jgi:DNA-binding response OmpR family regulator
MITENSIIFYVEDNKLYGKVVQSFLKKLGYGNVIWFQDERHCLHCMDQGPEVLILDYELNYMTGIKLLEEAKKKSLNFYTILLSGTFEKVKHINDMPLHYIDRYIRKNGYELKRLADTLNDFMNPSSKLRFF